jgi:predicted nucleotidyltransferase
MKFGLKEEVIGKISGLLSKYPEINVAVIYGSRAKGNYKPGSDIDLSLKGDKISLETLFSIAGKLDDSSLPYLFDISIFNQINNPHLIEHINRVGQVFYKRKVQS